MHQQIYVNLPVADLPRAKAFYVALGFDVVPAYTNDDAACIKLGDAIFAMLLVKPFFRNFTDKALADPATHLQTLLCLSCASRDEVDALVAKARAAGGTVPREPLVYPTMYGHGFADPDGHTWELMYVAPDTAPPHGSSS
jgi:predicted lactoylglutathione lyase